MPANSYSQKAVGCVRITKEISKLAFISGGPKQKGAASALVGLPKTQLTIAQHF